VFKTIFLSADSCKTNNDTVTISSEDDIHSHLCYLPHASRPPQKGAVVGAGGGADAGSKDQQPARRLNHLAPNWELTRRCAPLSRSKVAQPLSPSPSPWGVMLECVKVRAVMTCRVYGAGRETPGVDCIGLGGGEGG
jgi:hypothetical protein